MNVVEQGMSRSECTDAQVYLLIPCRIWLKGLFSRLLILLSLIIFTFHLRNFIYVFCILKETRQIYYVSCILKEQNKIFRRKRLSTGANFVHGYIEIWDKGTLKFNKISM